LTRSRECRKPTSLDRDFTGRTAGQAITTRDQHDLVFAYSPLEQVKNNLRNTGYDQNQIVYAKGKVEETIPSAAPATIAILRLDTDWYESTLHELVHLYPRLSVGGVLIIDDYGHWQGCRKAVDQYIAEHNLSLLLNRIDYTGRIAVKLQA